MNKIFIQLVFIGIWIVLISCSGGTEQRETIKGFPKNGRDTLIVVICDLTLENDDLINVVKEHAVSLLDNSFSSKKTIQYFNVDESSSGQIFEYSGPEGLVKLPDVVTHSSYAKYLRDSTREAKMFLGVKAKKRDQLDSILSSMYNGDFEGTRDVPRSCLIRSFYHANQTFRSRVGVDSEYQVLVLLSDMVIKCEASFCGETIMMDEGKITNILSACSLDFDMNYLDRLITVMPANSSSIMPEVLDEFWRKVFRKMKIPVDVVERVQFSPDLPKGAL